MKTPYQPAKASHRALALLLALAMAAQITISQTALVGLAVEAEPTAAMATASPEATASTSPEATASTSPEAMATASPEATASTSPEVTASTSPEVTASTSPEATASTSPEVTASTSPEVTASTSPEATASTSPEATATASPEATASAMPSVANTVLGAVNSVLETSEEIDVSYLTFNESTQTITACTNQVPDNALYIPATIGGVEVLYIGDNVFSGRSLVSVTFDENCVVKTIGASAFYGNTAITTIILPDTVTSIGASAFYGCTSLSSITSLSSSSLSDSNTLPGGITSIGSSAFNGCTSLTSIVLPENLTTLGSSAFYNCSSLASVNLPESITAIQSYTFYNTALTSINFHQNLTSIGSYAFYENDAWTSLDFTNATELGSIGSNAFYSNSALTALDFTGATSLTTIDTWAFYDCRQIASIDFTGATSLTSINSYAFYYCTGLTGEITLPSSVKTVSTYAFYYCYRLTKVYIKGLITSLNSNAFGECSALTEIHFTSEKSQLSTSVISAAHNSFATLYFGDTITIDGYLYIPGEGTLYGYVGEEKELTVPSSYTYNEVTTPVTSIANNAFYKNTNLTSVTLPSSIASIGQNVFRSCTNLTTANLSQATITALPTYAFYGCSKLTSVTLPASLTSIGNSAFYSCSLLASITLPENLTSIGSAAFRSCSALASITLPENLTSIGGEAFGYCTALTELTIPEGVTYINYWLIASSGVTTIYLPSTISSMSATAFQYASSLTEIWINLTEGELSGSPWGSTTASVYWNDTIKTADGNYVYSSTNQQLQKYIGTDTEVVVPTTVYDNAGNAYEVKSLATSLFASNTSITSVTIPDGFTSIPAYIFYGCTNLSSITLPNSATSIGDYAFYNTAITQISLPTSLESIGTKAFYSTNLTSIAFPTYLESIGSYAFQSCSSLTGDIILPDSVNSVGSYAFASTKITGITFPNAVTTIASSVASSCTSLQTVSMGNTVTSVNSSAFSGCTSLTSVTLSNILKTISSSAFSSCTSLESIDLPDTITTIDASAFYNCNKLTNFTLPASLSTIGSNAFYATTPTQLQIPSTVTSIDVTSFSKVSTLETLFVNQVRDDKEYHALAPWGATTADASVPTNVYFKGEAVVLNAEISAVEGEYQRAIVLETEAVDGLIVSKITLPEGLYNENGEEVEVGTMNIGEASWSATYYVHDNGDYLFGATSSNDTATSFTFTVEDIGIPVITSANSVSLTPSSLAGVSEASLITLAAATATDGVSALPITITNEDLAKVQALTESSPSVTISLMATSAFDKTTTTTKTISVNYVTSAKVLITADGETVYNAFLDTDSTINVKNDAAGTVTDTFTVAIENNITLPEAYEKDGHTFDEWQFSQEDSALVVTPSYTINYYTVAFDSQGGTAVSAQSCAYQTNALAPTGDAVPTRSGYAFVGWYTSTSYEVEYAFDTTAITADITLYAKWQHVHVIEYSATGSVITASCSNESEDCAYCANGYVVGTATLNTPASLVADDGSKEFTITYDDNWKTNLGETLTLAYTSGDSALNATPTDRGTYTVSVMLEDAALLTKTYVITPAVKAAAEIFANYSVVSTTYTNTSITFESLANEGYTFSLTEEGSYADTITFTAENDGSTKQTVYAKNANGKIFVTTITYCLENTAPSMSVSGAPEAWQNTTATLTITASDAAGSINSGLASAPYSFDGGKTWQTGNTLVVTENQSITVCVKDAAGNIATQTITEVKVDQVAPANITITQSPATPDGENNWYVTSKTITLTPPSVTATEAPVTSYYMLWAQSDTQPTEWVAFTAETKLPSQEGSYYLRTYTVDAAGNSLGVSGLISWSCDTVAPEITNVSYDTTKTFLDWLLGKESITFTITVADATSGIQNVAYRMTGADSNSADKKGTLTVSNGIATFTVSASWQGDISFTANDNAGLTSNAYTASHNGSGGVIVENDAPTITLALSADTLAGYYTGATSVGVTVQDKGITSGIATITYQINQQTPVVLNDFTTALTASHAFDVAFDATGIYTLTVTATDYVGNTSTVATEAGAILVDTKIDALHALMQEVDENTDIATLASIKATYDAYTQVEQYHLTLNPTAKAEVETLLTLTAAQEETLAQQQKILEIEKALQAAVDSTDYWVAKTAVAQYDALSEEEKAMVSSTAQGQYDTLVQQIAAIEAIIALVNKASNPSSTEYLTFIQDAKDAYDAYTQSTAVPAETVAQLEALLALRDAATTVQEMPLTTDAEIKAAKTAYESLAAQAQAMVDSTALDAAYLAMLETLDNDAKAHEAFVQALRAAQANPAVEGIAALEASYTALSEAAKALLSADEEADYLELVADRTTALPWVEAFDALDTTLRSEVDTTLQNYQDAALSDRVETLVEQATDLSIAGLTSALAAAKAVEALAKEIPPLDELDFTTYPENKALIEQAKEALAVLDSTALALVDPDAAEKITAAYEGLLSYLEYIVIATSTSTVVEVIGLAESVALPDAAATMTKTVIEITMEDSEPVVLPSAENKDVIVSVDIKLLSIMTDGENVFEEYVQPQEGSAVLLKLALPQGYDLSTLEIVHVKDNGERSILDIVAILTEDGTDYALFYTNSFSHFVFLAEKIVVPEDNASSGSGQDIYYPETEEEVEETLPQTSTSSKNETTSDTVDDTVEDTADTTTGGTDSTGDTAAQEGTAQGDNTEVGGDEALAGGEEEKESGNAGWRFLFFGLLGLFFIFFIIFWKRKKDEEEEDPQAGEPPDETV